MVDIILYTTDSETSVHDFRDVLTLDEKLTREQAIQKLLSFHKNSSEKAILDAFLNLRNLCGVTIVFEKSVSKGAPCINMRIYDEAEKWLSSSLIDEHTGQPIAHVS